MQLSKFETKSVIIDGLSSFTNARWLTIRTHDSAFIKIHVSVSPFKIRT